MRLLAGEFGCNFLNLRHAGHTSNKNQLVNITCRYSRFFEAVEHGLFGAVKERVSDLLQFRSTQRSLDVLWPSLVSRNKRKINIVALGRTERDLGFLSFLTDTLKRVWLAGKIDPFAGFKFGHNPVDDCLVPVITAEHGVTVGCQHLKDAVADFQHRDIKGATAQVINSDLLV